MTLVAAPLGANRTSAGYPSATVGSAGVEEETVGALDGFVLDQRRRGLAEGTIERRSRTLWSLRLWLGGAVYKATPAQIEEWLDDCQLEPASRYVYLSTVGAFFGWAVRTGLVDGDPTRDIPRPKLRRRLPRPMADDDLQKALAHADERMRCWLLLDAFAGFRCKEIALLRRDDVMDDRSPPMLFVADGKGGHEGLIPLHPEVLRALRAHGLPRRGYVFTKQSGGPYKPGTVSTYINRFLADLGIEATAHQGRHFFGTKVWAATRDLRVTQELLRHSDPKTTALYAAFDQELAVSAVNGLQARRPIQGDLWSTSSGGEPLRYRTRGDPPKHERAASEETARRDCLPSSGE